MMRDAVADLCVEPIDQADNVLRGMWAAEASCELIREALGGVSIGFIGQRVRALGLPLRNDKREVLLEAMDPNDHVHPTIGERTEEEE